MRWNNLLVIINFLLVKKTFSAESDYNIVQSDGSFDFRYDNPDSFHESHGNRNNVVKGVFGGRSPATGGIDSIEYTAGKRGFRPRGKNVVRKYDLGQTPVGPIGNKDDRYFDPYEDPSYNFQFNTPTYTRKEGANRLGDVKGTYSFFDDVGERHDVEYIAGKNTGFHVKTPHPDSNLNAFRQPYFQDPRKPYLRGRSFVQRGLDGSYRFAHVGRDQRRTETSDAVGNVRGSYTYRDDKGVQHSVHYIAGPNIGYRVLKNVKGPHLPTFYPFNSPDIVPPDFYDQKDADLEVFTEAASSYVTPPANRDGDYYPDNTNQVDINQSTKRPSTLTPTGDEDEELFNDFFANGKPGGAKRPQNRPTATRPNFGTTKRPGFITSTEKPDYGTPTEHPTTTGRPPFGFAETGRPDLDEDAAFDAGFGSNTGTRKPTFSTKRPSYNTGGPNYSTGRPSFTTTRPNFMTGRPSFTTKRPNYNTGKPDSDTSISVTSSGRPPTTFRPSSSFRPSSTFKPTTSHDLFPSTSTGFQQRPTTSRPIGGRPRPTIDDGLGLGEEDDEDIFGSNKPKPSSFSTSSGRPQPTSPTYSRPSSSRPGSTRPTSPEEEKPLLQFDLTEVEKGKFHTLVTNLGETLFTVPPGVSVRAHVQNIDLIPIFARSPSPSEQYNSEIDDEQENAETSNAPIAVIKSTINSAPSTTSIPSTTKKSVNTRTARPDLKEKDDDEDDDDDIDIF
ncbi:uncharacterized protein [Onthophagus taurus]|uniref:uncharacterized protein n=1 Tax=Onthophagus taurus TaxID=166361 RepID=UPI0039BE0A44